MAGAVCSHVQILLISIVVFVPFFFFSLEFWLLCEYVMENLKIIYGIRELGGGTLDFHCTYDSIFLLFNC